MIVHVELSTMSGCIVYLVKMFVVVWCLALLLVWLCNMV